MPQKLPRRYEDRTLFQKNRQRHFDAEFQAIFDQRRPSMLIPDNVTQGSPLAMRMGQLDLRGVPSQSMPNLQRNAERGDGKGKVTKPEEKNVTDYFDQLLSWVDEIEDSHPPTPEQRRRSASHSFHPYHFAMKRHSGPSPIQQLPSPNTYNASFMQRYVREQNKTGSGIASYQGSVSNLNSGANMNQIAGQSPNFIQVKRHSGQSGQSGSSSNDAYLSEYQNGGRYESRSSSISSASNFSYYVPNSMQWSSPYEPNQNGTNCISNNHHLMYNQQWEQVPHIVHDENSQQSW